MQEFFNVKKKNDSRKYLLDFFLWLTFHDLSFSIAFFALEEFVFWKFPNSRSKNNKRNATSQYNRGHTTYLDICHAFLHDFELLSTDNLLTQT